MYSLLPFLFNHTDTCNIFFFYTSTSFYYILLYHEQQMLSKLLDISTITYDAYVVKHNKKLTAVKERTFHQFKSTKVPSS